LRRLYFSTPTFDDILFMKIYFLDINTTTKRLSGVLRRFGVLPAAGILFSAITITFSCNGNNDNGTSMKTEKTFYPDGKLLSEKIFGKNPDDWTTIKYFENGDTSSIAHYHNWKYFGEAVIFYPNKQRNFQQNYDTSGQSDGMYYLWNMEGQLKETGLFVHGKKEGEFKTFFDNGQVQTIDNYKDGKKNGEALVFNEGGDTLTKEWYSNDSLVKISRP
jgi:antitoxin component YwqK of YwqJK toxin-antitoxin module